MIPIGIPCLFAVAQRPGGPDSNLATVAPLCTLEGLPLDPMDFLNHGLAFWRVSPRDTLLAEPGTLIIATILQSTTKDADHAFRLKPDSVRAPDASTLIEIIPSFPDVPIDHPRDVLLQGPLSFERPTAPSVLVEGSSSVYGLYNSNVLPVHDAASGFEVSFSSSGPELFQISSSDFEEFRRSGTIILKTEVSLDTNDRTKSWVQRKDFSYEVVLGASLVALRKVPKSMISARTPSEMLRPVIERYRNVHKINSFEQSFTEMLDAIADERLPLLPEQKKTLEHVQFIIDKDKRVLKELASSLVESGLLDDGIAAAKEERISRYIEEQTSQLSQQIREAIAPEQDKLNNLQSEFYNLQQTLAEERRKHEESLKSREHELTLRLAQKEAHLRHQEGELDTRKAEVDTLLSNASEYFSANRDNLIHTYLALEPLLKRIGLASNSTGDGTEHGIVEHTESTRTIEFPNFVTDLAHSHAPMNEVEFFERFKNRVKAKNYRYREEDLLAYHQNFKTSDFMILGGASGIGKSSLPRLYSDALEGEHAGRQNRQLTIPVSSTWMDVHDLLGHVNIVDRCFIPSETQLFRCLIYAAKEYAVSAHSSSLYSIVLDEMNLSHVEHYFSPFLQYLGSLLPPDDLRRVQIFDQDAVSHNHVFRDYASIDFPPTVRFIGTVNYDETTKQLSARVLDRGPLIQLRSAPAAVSASIQEATSTGRPVTYRHIREWMAMRRLDPTEIKLLNDLKPQLRILGCPLTPRRERAVESFIGTASPELFPDRQVPVDMALSQRLFPLIGRQLFRPAARKALDAIDLLLKSSGMELNDSLSMIAEMRESDFDGLQSA